MYVTGKTEFQDLNKLLIPICQVQLIIKLGEGMVYYIQYIANLIANFGDLIFDVMQFYFCSTLIL